MWIRYASIFILILAFTTPGFSQGLADEEMEFSSAPGTKWNLMGGIHIGSFDCNQTVKYPFSFGAEMMFHYYPKIEYPAFLGIGIGGFTIKGVEDSKHWGRQLDMSLFDVFMHVGYAFELNKNDNEASKYTLNIALGLPYVDFIQVKSTGPDFQSPTPAIGLGSLIMLDLPNRLSLFGTIYRMGKDMDGFGVKANGETIAANTKAVSYFYKWGALWRFNP